MLGSKLADAVRKATAIRGVRVNMKIFLIAIGTRGDVQPFVVIGSRLKAEGHDVHIAASGGFLTMISAAGLTHHPIPMNFQDLLQRPEMQGAMTTFWGKLKAYRWASEIMNDQLSAIWQSGLDLSPDLILYHVKGVLGPYLGRRLGVPAWPVMLQPGFIPTRDYPQFLMSTRSLGPVGNLASHRLIGSIMRRSANMLILRWHKATGIDVGATMDVRDGYAPHGKSMRIHAYSAQLAALGSDMPSIDRQVGYAFATPAAFPPPPSLEKFLSEGETPIYVGFGSMPGINQSRVNAALLGALERTGLRAVVATGWGGIGKLPFAKNIHLLETVPHTWLFPRVAAVVHHGGSGTTHESLRWGRPSVICPVFADQPYFGQRVADLGAGPSPIAQKHLTADRLADALEQALSEKMIARVCTIGDAMKVEDGASKVTELVQRIQKL
jgi:sterol 3beta-glucosyltransferase